MQVIDGIDPTATYLFQCHAILDQQRYPRVEISYVFFENEILLRLARDLRLEVALNLLGFQKVSDCASRHPVVLPRARSSSISKSFSFADIDRYKAVEYLLDWRAERPSCDEEMVFWRETGTNEEDDEVDALEMREGIIVAVCTDMLMRWLHLDEVGQLGHKSGYRRRAVGYGCNMYS